MSIGMLAPTLLDFGSETLKQRHLPKMLRGEHEFIQLLSEPSAGRACLDMAAHEFARLRGAGHGHGHGGGGRRRCDLDG
ncbi:MAG TPA: hypothetical protein VMU76_00975 [Acidimicrobiales bacterium]|nr:hypothetical protein [Acidimicrobiales bacterium]